MFAFMSKKLNKLHYYFDLLLKISRCGWETIEFRRLRQNDA